MGKFTFHLIKKLTGIDIEQLQNDNEALLIKNQQLSFEVKDANKEATYKRTQLTETQEELSLAQTELTQLQTSIAEHQKEISHLQTEISRLQSDKATGLEKMQYSEQEIVSRDNDIQQLKNQLADSERQKEVLATDKKELEAKLAEVEKQKEILEANKKELEEQSEKSSQDLAKNYTALQRELSETQEKLDAIQSENSTLKSNLSELQKKMHLLLEEKEQLIHEKEQMQTAQPESDKEEQPLPQPENEKVTAEPETPQKEEEQQPHSSDILEAYQEMKARLEESTLHYPYTRITSETNGCQYIYESRTLQLKAELFIWGVEGKEVVLEENHFIPYNEIAKIEGLETPFATDVMTCDFSEEGNGEEVAEALLMAICCYHPIHITYRDKNGRISERNLYWICFQPQGISSVRLPYEKIFRDMFDGEIDTDHIMAMCAHTPVPRIFIINQILSIQIYDAFVTTRKGIDTQIDGMYYAVLASQSEAADMIYKCLPEQFKKLPAVISYRAHYWMLEGDYQKAMKLYLSFAPDTEVEKGKTWAAMNIANFDKFIDNDVEAERFLQLKEALKEEGWPI